MFNLEGHGVKVGIRVTDSMDIGFYWILDNVNANGNYLTLFILFMVTFILFILGFTLFGLLLFIDCLLITYLTYFAFI